MEVYFDSIKLIQSSFGVAPEVLYSIDMNSVSLWEFMISMIHSEVSFTLRINQSIIRFPSIRIENSFIKVYFSLYDRSQSFCFTVWYDFGIDFHPSVFIFSFNQSKYWLLLCSSSSLEFSCKSSFSLRSEVTFIDLYFSAYFLFKFFHPIQVNNFSKYTKVSVDCFSIISEKFTCFRSINIYTKMLDNFFEFMFTDFAIWDHKKRVYGLFSSGLEPKIITFQWVLIIQYQIFLMASFHQWICITRNIRKSLKKETIYFMRKET